MEKLLRDQKDRIVQHWIDATLASYPPETVRFLKSEKNRFDNPVGHAVERGLKTVFDALIASDLADTCQSALDGIVRIRSVQDFTPSQVVTFVFALKQVVFEALEHSSSEPESLADWRAFEAKVDALALRVFDIYTKCREDLAEARLNDVKRRSHVFMEKFQCPSKIAPDQKKESNSFDGNLKGEDAQ